MRRALIVDDEPLVRERVRTLLAPRRDVEVIGECGDGRDAVSRILAERPDLVFLDVQMPELDGFEVVEALGAERPPAIVFITAFDEYAVRAFEVNAIDYLLKPIQADRFQKAVVRALEGLDRSDAAPDGRIAEGMEELRGALPRRTRFVTRSGSILSFVKASDVDWIEAADNYVRLHVGGRSQLVRNTLKNVEARLDADLFVRVHRSIIINLDRVASVEPAFHGEYVVTMKDGAKLTTSRSYSQRLRRLLSRS